MQYIKADTNTEVLIGPVVAVGDGFTPVTTLSLSTADEAEIIKYGGATPLTVTSISANGFAAITGADGYYTLDITTGNSDTEGFLTVLINDDSLCLPVRVDFMVVNANVYDSLFAASGTDVLDVSVTQWLGTAAATPTTAGVPEVDVNMWNGTALATTNPLPNAAAGAAGGLPTDSTGKTSFNDIAATAIVSAGAITTSSGAVSSVGSVSGSVGSVTGAVGSVTGNVGGNVVGSVASVTGAVGSVTGTVTVGTNNDKTGYSLAADFRIKTNTALNNFSFLMVDASGDPATGLTVTAQRSIDGAALGACANAVSELSNGLYLINLAASDLNGTVITLRFTAAGAKDRVLTVITQTE